MPWLMLKPSNQSVGFIARRSMDSSYLRCAVRTGTFPAIDDKRAPTQDSGMFVPLFVNLVPRLTRPVTVCCPTASFRIQPEPQAGSNTVQWLVSQHSSGQWATLCFVCRPSLPFACFTVLSLQSRFTQRNKLTLQGRWILDRNS